MNLDLVLRNLLPMVGSAFFTAILTYLFARSHKRFDARSAAEDKLIESGPAIIREQNIRIAAQNTRIDSLEASYSSLWRELAASMEKERQCLSKLYEQDSEINTLKRRVASLERGAGDPTL